MSDRELLELAAKAAGLVTPRYHEATGKDYDCGTCILHDTHGGRETHSWNPLEDDGEALRLAANLGFSIHVLALSIGVSQHDGPGYLGGWLKRGVDDEADYRLAIVRAAAELGKAMRPA